MSAGSALRLSGVTAGYGGRAVLREADLEVERGTVVGMIGPNGSGKSTALRLLLGQLEPLSGAIEVLGTTPRAARPRVGYVPQSLSVERSLPASLLELVDTGHLGLPRGGGRREERLRRIEARAAEVGIDGLLGRRVSALSGGQLQLGLVARALVRDPELLLLDEPTANADARAESSVFSLLSRLGRARTVLVVSHDIGVLSRSVDSIACVGAGRIVHHLGRDVPVGALEEAYGCPVELIAHGHPHRVLAHHPGDGCGHDHAGEDAS